VLGHSKWARQQAIRGRFWVKKCHLKTLLTWNECERSPLHPLAPGITYSITRRRLRAAMLTPRNRCPSLPRAHPWATALEISEHGVTCILRKWQPGGPSPLAVNTQQGVPPIDIDDPQMTDIAGSQAETCQKEHNRPVPKARRRGIARGYDSFYAGRAGVSPEWSQAAPRHRRNGMIKRGTALVAHCQETEVVAQDGCRQPNG
jgi:hypothetical protein